MIHTFYQMTLWPSQQLPCVQPSWQMMIWSRPSSGVFWPKIRTLVVLHLVLNWNSNKIKFVGRQTSPSKLTHTPWRPLSLTSRKEYLFWWTHSNSSPIRILLNAPKMGFLIPYFVVWIRKLHNRPSMTMSLSQSQGGTTCKPHISWVPFLFLSH